MLLASVYDDWCTVLLILCLLLICVQRVGDEPVVFAENQSWEAPKQVFAEEGKYSLTHVLFTLIT